jgi:phosphatidate cytidylyltransferase
VPSSSSAGFSAGLSCRRFKRDLGVKDWGRMIEGHGGVFDRMDSVSFASPLFLQLARYWFAA